MMPKQVPPDETQDGWDDIHSRAGCPEGWAKIKESTPLPATVATAGATGSTIYCEERPPKVESVETEGAVECKGDYVKDKKDPGKCVKRPSFTDRVIWKAAAELVKTLTPEQRAVAGALLGAGLAIWGERERRKERER